MQFVTYSKKSVAVLGDCRTVKNDFALIGGKFNGFLTHPQKGTKTAGWIFATKHTEAVQRLIKA